MIKSVCTKTWRYSKLFEFFSSWFFLIMVEFSRVLKYKLEFSPFNNGWILKFCTYFYITPTYFILYTDIYGFPHIKILNFSNFLLCLVVQSFLIRSHSRCLKKISKSNSGKHANRYQYFTRSLSNRVSFKTELWNLEYSNIYIMKIEQIFFFWRKIINNFFFYIYID